MRMEPPTAVSGASAHPDPAQSTSFAQPLVSLVGRSSEGLSMRVDPTHASPADPRQTLSVGQLAGNVTPAQAEGLERLIKEQSKADPSLKVGHPSSAHAGAPKDQSEEDEEEEGARGKQKQRSKGKKKKGAAGTRRPWNDEEDEAIAALVKKHGTKQWSLVARMLDREFRIVGRTGKQCRERYR